MSILGTIMRDGVVKTLKKTMKFNTLYRGGKQIGSDSWGNKYFTNVDLPQGQNRWVELAKDNPNGSQVPPEWHSWLHYVTDIPGPALSKKYAQKYALPHKENPTGTSKRYTPPNFILNQTKEKLHTDPTIEA